VRPVVPCSALAADLAPHRSLGDSLTRTARRARRLCVPRRRRSTSMGSRRTRSGARPRTHGARCARRSPRRWSRTRTSRWPMTKCLPRSRQPRASRTLRSWWPPLCRRRTTTFRCSTTSTSSTRRRRSWRSRQQSCSRRFSGTPARAHRRTASASVSCRRVAHALLCCVRVC